jgi:simple sugar transport system substrate-binding protein
VKRALILDHEVGNAALEQRVKGFEDGFEGPFHHVDVLPVPRDFTPCQRAITAYLRGHEDVDGLVALGPVAAEPALQSIEEVGKTGRIKLCTFDLSLITVQALIKKQVDFAVDQQPWLQGYLPVVYLANYAQHGLMVQSDLVLTGPSFVMPENASRVADLLTLGFR